MHAKPLYQVLLLPAREVAVRHQTLAEASAWVRTYNEALAEPRLRAVIAEEPAERDTSPTRLMARSTAA